MKKFFIFFFLFLISCNTQKKIEKISTEAKSSSEKLVEPEEIKRETAEDFLERETDGKNHMKMSRPEETRSDIQTNRETENRSHNFSQTGSQKKKQHRKEESETDDVKMGNLIYHIPDTMVEKKTYIIRIRLNRDSSDNTIKTGISEKVVESVVKTTSRMEVEIIDPSPQDKKNFEIVKSNEDIQLMDDNGFTEWVFGVTPLKSGTMKLNLVISIIKGDDKKQVVYFDDVYVKTNPKANLIDFTVKYWQWFMSTIIIPFIVWFYNKKKKKD